MRRKIIFKKCAVLIFAFMLAEAVTSAPAAEKKEDMYEQIELLTDAISYIRANYVKEVSAKDLIYGALEGLLESLDPYSQFMDPKSFKEMRVETKGEYGGIGIEISIKDGLLTVIAPIEGAPAHKAGVKSRDRIVRIDGVSTKDISLMDAVEKLRGKPGTEVALTILREDEGRIFDVKIARAVIKIESITRAEILEDKIGYIRLAEFQENTLKDMDSALKKLKDAGMDSLILDLRNNPGGLLEASVDVAGEFLQKGKVIVITRGRLKEDEVSYKSGGGRHTDIPFVILVDGGSASASEIVAGAIQDNKRGVLIGEKTFGKGSVQTVIPLKDLSALRLTTAEYFTPNGRAIQKEGLMPDVVVEYEEPSAEREAKEKADEVFEKVEDTDGKKDIAKDNQLLRAVDLLKGIRAFKRLEKGE